MAEIRSTMDMVLERAERLCSQTDTTSDANSMQEGMKAGALMLQDKEFDIAAPMNTMDADAASKFVKGVLSTLLRNITLPRDEGTPWHPAMQAIEHFSVSLNRDTSQLQPIISEINNILSRYHEHRQQVVSQLEEAFNTQAAQMQQNMKQETGRQTNISAAQHPKFNEELQRHYDQLSEQYTNALEQYKQAITQIFT